MSRLAPVSIADGAESAYARRGNLQFALISLLVRALPRGKVIAARLLGRRLLLGPRGVVETDSGVAIAVDRSNIDFFAELQKRNGAWDPHVTDACLRLLAGRAVFYDVGANSGYVALEVAARAPGVEVIAFEPQPGLAHNIAVSSALNRLTNVRVYAAMLGSRDGTGTIFLAPQSIHASAVARYEGSPSIACPSASIDALVESGGLPPPDLIKIDVEGAEADVFAGAVRTIRHHRPALVFEADMNLERFGQTRGQLLAYLASLAPYELFFLEPDGRMVAVDGDPANASPNLVAIPLR
ncbi:MAG TPA: FkbM family methyltransferase [Myxococcota bacterium]|nr:FkbM family methyltransferase [Myxococcota bacterium]